MREEDLLARIRERSASLPARFGAVRVGPGDDCAVVRWGNQDLVIGVDQLVEGRHFLPATPVDAIARKLIGRALSDIAAMGAKPVWALATGVLPRGFENADALFDAMHECANLYGCPLVGGDIASSGGDFPLVLTMTAAGRPNTGRGPVLRSDARPGDGVFVTGLIGGSFDSGHHLDFTPRLREGDWLCDTLVGRLHAMIDVSDGLGIDAGRLARASGVAIELDAADIPRRAGVDDPLKAAADGEDYELLFTAAGDVPDRCPDGTPLTCIGRVIDGKGCTIRTPDGREVDADQLGWDHGT